MSIDQSRPATSDALLPVRMLNEYAYCPRLFHLMHTEGLWADNAFTQDGKRVHKRVDRLDQVLPEAEQAPTTSNDAAGDEPPQISRSVSISCPVLGLSGKLDLVSCDGAEAVPVETKRGKVPDNPEQSWEPERVQLMAQGLLLRSQGYHCDHGFLYFAASRRRVEIRFTTDLEDRCRSLLREAQTQQQRTEIPDPLEDSPKCSGCSLAGLCLPDETRALRAVPLDPDQPQIRRLYPAREDTAPLYVQEQGAWIGVKKGVLTIRKSGDTLGQARLKDLDHLVCCGNVQLGTQALHLLCEAGIPICHLSCGHWFYGFTSGFTLRNAYDKAAQFQAAADPARCLHLARDLIAAKGANQRTVLQRNAEPRPAAALSAMSGLLKGIDNCKSLAALLGQEGMLARHYFAHFASMLKNAELADAFQEEGRKRRPPPDPVNALLSFGYALLSKECTVALAAAGLDPFWGFYHQPRHGRPALALDLMEEFRPLIVDSAVLSAINTSMVTRSDFTIGRNGCLLKPPAKKAFIRALEARFDQLVTHPVLGYRVSWRAIIRLQARLLARWLRGDIPAYRGVTTR